MVTRLALELLRSPAPEVQLRGRTFDVRALCREAADELITGWWFGTCYIYIYIYILGIIKKSDYNWLIFFRGVGTTSQINCFFFLEVLLIMVLVDRQVPSWNSHPDWMCEALILDPHHSTAQQLLSHETKRTSPKPLLLSPGEGRKLGWRSQKGTSGWVRNGL